MEEKERDTSSLRVNKIEENITSLADQVEKSVMEKALRAEKSVKEKSNSAEKFAKNSSSVLGKLLNGHMGVFQITAKHSTEKYTWGGTHNKTSRYNTAHITMNLPYDVQ